MRRIVAFTLVLGSFATLAQPAHAAPRTPRFGRVIEGYARYQAFERCRPRPKPGVVAFGRLLRATYPRTTWIGIERGCEIGGPSEHKEGRALDWSANAKVRADRRMVRDLLVWLFATDRRGNRHAMARRLGVMYVIWNRRMWSTWSKTWDTYCVQRKRGCVSTRSRSVVHPHDDHVHFSFSWAGARKRTTFWNPERSFP